MAKHKDFHLTARIDIGSYRKGDHIEDEAQVTALMKSEHRHHFIRVAADPLPASRFFPASRPRSTNPGVERKS